jgi:hypothetical protein
LARRFAFFMNLLIADAISGLPVRRGMPAGSTRLRPIFARTGLHKLPAGNTVGVTDG